MQLLLPDLDPRKQSLEDRLGRLRFQLGRLPLYHKCQFLLQFTHHLRSTSLRRMV